MMPRERTFIQFYLVSLLIKTIAVLTINYYYHREIEKKI